MTAIHSGHDEPASTVADLAVLFLIVGIPAAFYITGLGLYSDDWWFHALMQALPDQSLSGLFAAMIEKQNLAPRPVQVLILDAVHLAFGRDPFWGHVLNHFVFWLSGAVLYFAMCRAPVPRLVALMVAAVYLSIPHYSTARLWFANYQAGASLLFFSLTLYAWVRASQHPARSGLAWVVAGALAMTVSLLSYELFMPIFVAVPTAILAHRFVVGDRGPALTRVAGRMALATVVALLVAASVAAYKIAVFPMEKTWTLADWLRYAPGLYRDAVRTSFWTLGMWLPVNAARTVMTTGVRPGPIVAGLLAGLLLYMALARAARSVPEPGFGARSPWMLAGATMIGVGTFAAGCLVVIYNYYANYAPTGIANRISIASAMGVAIVVVTVAATLDWSLRARFRRTVTLTLVSAFCALGIFMNATIGVLWVEAATIQETVFATLAATLPRVPDGASVMLFGQCPYHGPATVYTSSWDLQGRLQLDIGLSHVRADIITEDSTIGPEGLTNREYDLTATYPFGELYVFDSRAGDVTRLADLAAATAYFAARPIDHATGCAFRDGEGQRLF